MNKAPRRTTPDYDTPVNATEPRIVAEPLLDLFCKAIQILIALNIEAWKNLHQVEDIGHQRRVEAGFRLVQPIHHVGDHLAQPIPQILGAASQGLAYIRIDLAGDTSLLLGRHLHPEVRT
jgi:hypothetical protein